MTWSTGACCLLTTNPLPWDVSVPSAHECIAVCCQQTTGLNAVVHGALEGVVGGQNRKVCL